MTITNYLQKFSQMTVPLNTNFQKLVQPQWSKQWVVLFEVEMLKMLSWMKMIIMCPTVITEGNFSHQKQNLEFFAPKIFNTEACLVIFAKLLIISWLQFSPFNVYILLYIVACYIHLKPAAQCGSIKHYMSIYELRTQQHQPGSKQFQQTRLKRLMVMRSQVSWAVI